MTLEAAASGLIPLSAAERELFDMFLAVVRDKRLDTTIRVAGGWVRDKLLQLPSKDDIDIALDNMTGVPLPLTDMLSEPLL